MEDTFEEWNAEALFAAMVTNSIIDIIDPRFVQSGIMDDVKRNKELEELKKDISSDAFDFIFSDRLDEFATAFGVLIDPEIIRNKTKKILSDEVSRSKFMRHCGRAASKKYF